MSDWLFWLLYISPSLIAWYRSRQGRSLTVRLAHIFWFNLFMGWTVVGWFVSLAHAFGKNPIAWIAFKIVQARGGAHAGGQPAQHDAAAPFRSNNCGQCQGSGSVSCSSCGGRGTWYDPPQGEHGVAQLRSCPSCTSSGRLRCPYCGGSGQSP